MPPPTGRDPHASYRHASTHMTLPTGRGPHASTHMTLPACPDPHAPIVPFAPPESLNTAQGIATMRSTMRSTIAQNR